MDPRFSEFAESVNGFRLDDKTVFPNFNQSPNHANGFKFKDESLDLSFLDPLFLQSDPDPGTLAPSSGTSSEVDSPDDFSDTVREYLEILMEEKMEEKPSMFHDPLALQAAEKSFYEVLGVKYPPSPYQLPVCIDQTVQSPDDNFFGSSSEYNTNSSTSADNYFDPQLVGGSIELKSTVGQTHPLDYFSQSTSQRKSWSFSSVNSFNHNFNGPEDSCANTHLIQNIFSDNESILQFKRGMDEASKFLPSGGPLVIDLECYSLPLDSKESDPVDAVKVEKDEKENSPNGSRVRKHYHQDDGDFEEERSSKQSAVCVDESALSEMFDRVLLFTNAKGEPIACTEELTREACEALQHNGETQGSNSGKTRAKKMRNESEAMSNKSEVIDLRTLLITCAQSVAADELRTANEQLKQIRQHASPSGDVYQRLAHIFANGIEARLAGMGSQIYATLASRRISAIEKLKAYQVYLSSNPFKKISIFFANKMIIKTALKATTLHIIDFGILYGFQWPLFIQVLSMREGGPPKLRITGIELPQAGFRPAELVEETGRRLANYCERFNVPFEYHAIATQEWERIKIEDLKIESNEVLAVNCLFRFKNLDETVVVNSPRVVVNSPRDAVLKLIRKMNPDIFVQAVTNGSYGVPFFVTRFREALFHYSALFDVFEATLTREDQHRFNFEQEFYGHEVMNVIACEGEERVERPETYKQWQIRNIRAGFRPLPLNKEMMNRYRSKVKAGYHKDFDFDEDGPWMLQGWKGRILYASSCWVPA